MVDTATAYVSVHPAAAIDGQANSGVLDLPSTSFAAHLVAQFHHLRAARGPERMTTAQESATGIHRYLSVEAGLACAYQMVTFAFLAQADLGILQQFRRRRRIV